MHRVRHDSRPRCTHGCDRGDRAGVFVIRAPWGMALVATAVIWEIAEKAFWLISTKRRTVEVVAPCRPCGAVRLRSERWNARCREGADVGDIVIVESGAAADVDRLLDGACAGPRTLSRFL